MPSGKSHQSTPKRLLHELQSYADEPNPALLHLGPDSDDELLQWSAVMKGVPGSAYEGWNSSRTSFLALPSSPPTLSPTAQNSLTTPYRRSLGTLNLNPANISSRSPYDQISHPYLPPKCALQNRRDMLGPT